MPQAIESEWKKTACILCECNCGLEVKMEGRHFKTIRGDKAHPASQGYACEKAHRIDYYQNGKHRLSAPLRRRDDGTFEEIDWDTAIREIAARLVAVRDTYGGESIFYYGGGGQGNHLGGGYAGATLKALGAVYRSNALAQEKTGEMWVNSRMFGCLTRGDFEHAEVALFIGKNPWHSHSIPRARVTLKEIAKDPKRCLIVIDPRRTETAEIADVHLQVRPGTDAWLLAAMLGVLVQEDLLAKDWLSDHAVGLEPVVEVLRTIPVAEYCRACGVDEELVRSTTRRIAAASSTAVFEDLGVQMNLHSTLNSYLEKLLWSLTGNFGKPGAQYAPATLVNLFGGGPKGDQAQSVRGEKLSPVVGARIIGGLVPCNVIPDEILTDHPKRYRAMIVESGNPAHSLADSQRMRQAMKALDTLVVIDVAMTETARLAHYVLPPPSQYEKYESTFFNFDFPHNVFHLRHPLLEPEGNVLPEPEIHSRLVEAIGAVTDEDLAPLREAAARGRQAFGEAFFGAVAANPKLNAIIPVVLYRTLGPTLPDGAASAAALWGAAHLFAMSKPDSVRRAGFTGAGLEPGEKLFEAILAGESGVVFSVDDYEDSWPRVRNGKINLAIDEMLDELKAMRTEAPPAPTDEFPFVLSAGERRSFTANTILRNPDWRKKDNEGALRINPEDAERLGIVEGGRALLSTKRASLEVAVEISPTMQPGHISLPNGLGLDYPNANGEHLIAGTAPNELTASEDRDWLAGTPWHKYVRARVEAVA